MDKLTVGIKGLSAVAVNRVRSRGVYLRFSYPVVMKFGPSEPSTVIAQDELGECELIDLIVRGEKSYFRVLLERYEARIYSLIRKQVGEDGVAQDLTQEVFVKAFRHLAKFERRAQFATWLTRIAINTTNSYFTSREFKERLRTVELEPIHTVEAPDTMSRAGDLERMRLVIGSLPEHYRGVLILVAYDEKSYEEVAEILKIPIGTVRSRLHAARKMVREKFLKLDAER